jgi:hypothetical protein
MNLEADIEALTPEFLNGVDPSVLVVIATLVVVFSGSSIIAAWVERTWPVVSLISFLIGVALFVALHVVLLQPEGLTLRAIPNAFINVAAMILS